MADASAPDSLAFILTGPLNHPTLASTLLRVTFDEAHEPSILAAYTNDQLLPLAVYVDAGEVGRVLLDLLPSHTACPPRKDGPQ